EARDIIWQSAATFIGTAVGARVSKPMLEGFKVGGRALGLRIKAINVQRAQVRLKAAALEKSGNIKQAPEVLAKDSELLDQEQALLKDIIKTANDPNWPAEAKMTQDQLAELGELRKQNAAAQEGNARSRVMFKLEPAGGDVFLAPKGELNSKGGIADQYRELG